MSSTITHMHSRPKNHKKPESQRNHAYQQEQLVHNNSAWIKRLTTTAVDPLTLRHHLKSAGGTLRNQTFRTLQHQNGNRHIQRDAIHAASTKGGHSFIEELMGAMKTGSKNPVTPVPVPYPNMADISSGDKATNKVKFKKKEERQAYYYR